MSENQKESSTKTWLIYEEYDPKPEDIEYPELEKPCLLWSNKMKDWEKMITKGHENVGKREKIQKPKIR